MCAESFRTEEMLDGRAFIPGDGRSQWQTALMRRLAALDQHSS